MKESDQEVWSPCQSMTHISVVVECEVLEALSCIEVCFEYQMPALDYIESVASSRIFHLTFMQPNLLKTVQQMTKQQGTSNTSHLRSIEG